MNNESLQYLELNTGPEPDAAVIWLHGLGADGHDFEAIVPELDLPEYLKIRFIFPHAPMRPVTINQGHVMRAWYDIVGPDLAQNVDEAGIRQSQQLIDALLDRVCACGIAPDRIILAGFSQGGVIALATGLRRDPPLGGIIALSTYIPVPGQIPPATADAPPILMIHGRLDPLIPLPLAEAGCKVLQAQGYRVEWHVFAMAHSVCLEEISVIRRWLIERLA